jgi:alpha-beta hydrolase superfamily lysophospholipase
MKKALSILTLLLTVLMPYTLNGQENVDNKTITGSWIGKIPAGGISLRVIFNLSLTGKDSLTATMDSPDQGVKGIKVGPVKFDGKDLNIKAPILLGEYNGTLKSDTLIEGIWKQAGNTFDLNLTRLAGVFTLNKPQEPKPPLPYTSEDVTFKNDKSNTNLAGTKFNESEIVLKTSTGDIYGTLTLPDKPKKSPVVLIIAGSGPTDRDGNSSLNIRANTYKMLADGFALNGISTLRYDKRAIAKSRAAAMSESDLRFETYINDAIEWINLLNKDKRFSKIIVLGHSEGSLIGIVAAEKSSVSKYISVAGAGSPIDTIVRKQLKNQLPEPLFQESNKILDSLRMGKTVEKFNPVLASLYRLSVQPYLISWIKYDPTTEMKKLKIPVLIVQGTTDIQISVDDARLLYAAKSDAKLLIIDNMNHILKEAEADRQKNIATYTNPELPLKQGLIEELVSFIKNKK